MFKPGTQLGNGWKTTGAAAAVAAIAAALARATATAARAAGAIAAATTVSEAEAEAITAAAMVIDLILDGGLLLRGYHCSYGPPLPHSWN